MTESGHIPDDATPIFHEIDNQSDRAAAVVAGSFVERALQIAIEAEWHIPSNTVRDRIFTGNGPLATFSGKIEVGFAMGIYGPRARRDLHRIRKIRNRFAHELNPITFDMPEMKELCESIELTQRTPIPDLSVRKITPQRYKYERACKSFVFVFGVRADELQKSWPDKSAPRPPLPTLS